MRGAKKNIEKVFSHLANVVAVRVGLLAKRNGRVAPEVLVKVGRARQPLPVEVVDAGGGGEERRVR